MKRLLILCTMSMLYPLAMLHAQQRQPDQRRVLEIKATLIAHGYKAGKTWPETQEILRDIARKHGWQTHRAPDARVLILLGLGNRHSNSDVLEWPKNELD